MGSGEVVLITGCSTGIGFETALECARRGYVVYAGVRRKGSDDHLLKVAARENLAVRSVSLDVADAESVLTAVRHVQEEASKIDVVVNNAGVSMIAAVEETAVEDALHLYDVNVLGALRIVRAVLPQMRSRGSGHIINISSINGLIPVPFVGMYAASKHALEAMTEALAIEVERFGVRVHAVEPGNYRTAIDDNKLRSREVEAESSVYAHELGVAAAIRQMLAGAADDVATVAMVICDLMESASDALRHVVGADATGLIDARAAMGEREFNAMMKAPFRS
jgi:NAD(P)-dependent dehydrogenase (short-subunit alcohol dehydrogenase family)